MKSDFIKNIIKQVVCWILVLQMINISINPPDFRKMEYASVNHPEDLANEFETVYELVVEGIFDEDVPESKEDEIDTSSSLFELYLNGSWSQLPSLEFPFEYYPHYNSDFLIVHKEPLFQPPKHA